MSHSATADALDVFAPGHLGELTQILPFEMVDAALEIAGGREQRLRRLPSRVVRSASNGSPGPSGSGSRSTASTADPSASSRAAMARPMPLAAPVTSARRMVHRIPIDGRTRG